MDRGRRNRMEGVTSAMQRLTVQSRDDYGRPSSTHPRLLSRRKEEWRVRGGDVDEDRWNRKLDGVYRRSKGRLFYLDDDGRPSSAHAHLLSTRYGLVAGRRTTAPIHLPFPPSPPVPTLTPTAAPKDPSAPKRGDPGYLDSMPDRASRESCSGDWGSEGMRQGQI